MYFSFHPWRCHLGQSATFASTNSKTVSLTRAEGSQLMREIPSLAWGYPSGVALPFGPSFMPCETWHHVVMGCLHLQAYLPYQLALSAPSQANWYGITYTGDATMLTHWLLPGGRHIRRCLQLYRYDRRNRRV